MVERGGPTNQAGIEYQNHLAALYLGDLLRLDDEGRDRVVEVRVEAPAHVDDIVVRYADHRRRWVQAKLSLKVGEPAWSKLWENFDRQLADPLLRHEDRLRLALGEETALARDLKACAAATEGSDDEGWARRLTVAQQKITAAVAALLGKSAFEIFRRLDVEILTLAVLLKEEAARRMPPASVAPAALLDHLVTAAGGKAKQRGLFNAPDLRQRLMETVGVRLDPPPRWGLAAYLKAMGDLRVAVPGTSVGGSAAQAFLWPRTVLTDAVQGDFDDEQRLDDFDRGGLGLDLRTFPTRDTPQAIVHAGPGFGKSALLQALAQTLAASGLRTPAIVPLGALAEGSLTVIDYLQNRLNADYAVNIDWLRLCETGAAVVLLDGLDEVDRERRADIVARIARFAGRFPDTPWLMTVRDPAIVPGDFDAPKVELLPLVRSDMEHLVRAVRPDLEPARVEVLLEQIEAYPDLDRLVRIPLFLALLVATWTPGEAVPRQGRAARSLPADAVPAA